nr:hypothetical protein [Tanacetum cinerariifolium]
MIVFTEKCCQNITHGRKDIQREFLHVKSENEDGENNFGGAQNEGMDTRVAFMLTRPVSVVRRITVGAQNNTGMSMPIQDVHSGSRGHNDRRQRSSAGNRY